MIDDVATLRGLKASIYALLDSGANRRNWDGTSALEALIVQFCRCRSSVDIPQFEEIARGILSKIGDFESRVKESNEALEFALEAFYSYEKMHFGSFMLFAEVCLMHGALQMDSDVLGRILRHNGDLISDEDKDEAIDVFEVYDENVVKILGDCISEAESYLEDDLVMETDLAANDDHA